MEDKKMDYEKEKTYSMGELYKEYKEKYEERNEKRKERGEPVANGVPCSEKRASEFLRELARAVGVYKEFVDSNYFKKVFNEKSDKPVESKGESEIKNKRGNPNWHFYEFTEQEKDAFIELLDYKEEEDVKKCEGLKKDNLEANPDIREMIEQIFIDYLGNHLDYFDRAASYNCFERHLWVEYKENIYPINGMVNKFLEFVDGERELIENLLPEFLKKVIIEYDKGIYWLMKESLNIIRDLIFEFTIDFSELFEGLNEFCRRREENGEDIDPEGRQQYMEIICRLLQAESFRKERKLAKELREKKYHLHNDSKKINEYKDTEIEFMEDFEKDFLKYKEYIEQHPETEKRGIDTYMMFGRWVKYGSMDELLKLLEEEKIDFKRHVLEKIKGRIDKEWEESQKYFERYM